MNDVLEWLIQTLQKEMIPLLYQKKGAFNIIQDNAKKHKKDSLIAKSSGLVGNIVGTSLSIAGLITAPVTLGATTPLIVTGLSVGGAGGIITFSTKIAEFHCAKKYFKNVKEHETEFIKKLSHWVEILNTIPELVDAISTHGYPEHYYSWNDATALWLRLRLYRDHRIDYNDLRPNDHIYRRVRSNFRRVLYHHGVCIELENEKFVVEFGRDSKPKLTPLSKFVLNDTELYRRDYKRWDMSPFETLKKTKFILRAGFPRYRARSNNCEHFATNMKFGIDKTWSEQQQNADQFFKKVTPHLSTVGRATELGLFAAGLGVNVTRRAAPAAVVISTVAKVGFWISPVATLLDAGMLFWDFKKVDENLELLQSAIKSVDAYIEMFEHNLQVLIQHQKDTKGNM